MDRIFVIGDIHGAHIPLKQCLERSGFDKENDLLITLGDICDGWPYVYECVEELLTIKNRIDIIGNHDNWFQYWLQFGLHPDEWAQGGRGTALSYLREIDKEDLIQPKPYSRGYITALNSGDIPESHRRFFENQIPYYKDDKKRLFIHAGFYRFQTLSHMLQQDPSVFYWDRDLWNKALSVHKGEKLKFKEEFTEIYIGHTATLNWSYNEKKVNSIIIPGNEPITTPMHADIIWNLDTGAGSHGKLTIMDIDTKQYWQSDPVNDIYGEYKPRG